MDFNDQMLTRKKEKGKMWWKEKVRRMSEASKE